MLSRANTAHSSPAPRLGRELGENGPEKGLERVEGLAPVSDAGELLGGTLGEELREQLAPPPAEDHNHLAAELAALQAMEMDTGGGSAIMSTEEVARFSEALRTLSTQLQAMPTLQKDLRNAVYAAINFPLGTLSGSKLARTLAEADKAMKAWETAVSGQLALPRLAGFEGVKERGGAYWEARPIYINIYRL